MPDGNLKNENSCPNLEKSTKSVVPQILGRQIIFLTIGCMDIYGLKRDCAGPFQEFYKVCLEENLENMFWGATIPDNTSKRISKE